MNQHAGKFAQACLWVYMEKRERERSEFRGWNRRVNEQMKLWEFERAEAATKNQIPRCEQKGRENKNKNNNSTAT